MGIAGNIFVYAFLDGGSGIVLGFHTPDPNITKYRTARTRGLIGLLTNLQNEGAVGLPFALVAVGGGIHGREGAASEIRVQPLVVHEAGQAEVVSRRKGLEIRDALFVHEKFKDESIIFCDRKTCIY